jgi:GTP-binding protein HflX
LAEPRREELKVRRRKGILVAVVDPQDPTDRAHVLDEIRGLAETAGITVVGELVQARAKPDIATCLGSGKVEELRQLVHDAEAELIVFDNNLTPAQGRNLEEETKTVIVDRSEVILDIFASNARTYEAQLQVELAQLLYYRHRLKRMWTHLERIEGGVGTGRGPGEKQLETDRRLIDKRVDELRRRLGEIEKRRELTVSQRREQPTVSLVGYTNAGKSTLMNALTGAGVYVADKLFATLDTRTRRWKIPRWGEVLLSDTVGFIRNLPHHLVASFRSTLQEARSAELLLHVVDSSHPEAERQVETVFEVLSDIGVDREKVLLVLNKIDRLENRAPYDVLRAKYADAVGVSAVTGEGVDRLGRRVAELLGDGFREAEIETDVGNGRLFAFLAEHADVLDRQYRDARVVLRARLANRFAQRLETDGPGTTVRWLAPHENGHPPVPLSAEVASTDGTKAAG